MYMATFQLFWIAVKTKIVILEHLNWPTNRYISMWEISPASYNSLKLFTCMQPRHEVPSYVGVQLCVQGYALPKPRSYSYIRKTVSNMSDSENVVADSIPTSNSSPVQQVSSDSKAKIISERNVTNQTSRKEISDSCVHSSNSKPTNSSSSTPSIQSSVATPTSPFRIGQTCFSCGTDFNQSRPGTSVNIVEINCKLPNTNLRVS